MTIHIPVEIRDEMRELLLALRKVGSPRRSTRRSFLAAAIETALSDARAELEEAREIARRTEHEPQREEPAGVLNAGG